MPLSGLSHLEYVIAIFFTLKVEFFSLSGIVNRYLKMPTHIFLSIVEMLHTKAMDNFSIELVVSAQGDVC